MLSFSPEDTLEAQGERAALVESLPWPVFDFTATAADTMTFFVLDTVGAHFSYGVQHLGVEEIQVGDCEVQTAHFRYYITRYIPSYSSRFLAIDYYIRDEIGIVKEIGSDTVLLPAGLSHAEGWEATLTSYRITDTP